MNQVPTEVAEVIRRRGFFGYRRPAATKASLPQPAGFAGLCDAGTLTGPMLAV